MSTVNQMLSRKERERMRHRQDIIDAALSLFSERGYHEVTMQDIAVKAEFGTGTLYNFFASKKEMLAAIILDKAAGFIEEGLAIVQLNDEPDVVIRRYVQKMPQTFWERKELIHLFYKVCNGFDRSGHEELDRVVHEHIDAIHLSLQRVLLSGCEKGVFREMNVEYGAWQITDTVIGFIRRSLFEDVYDTDVLDQIESILLAGIAA